MPTPPGYPRPPYGVSTSPRLLPGATWTPMEGSCSDTNPALSFPKGATHGSFVCLTDAEYARVVAAFPPAASAAAATTAPTAGAPWQQDRFVISAWVDPVVPPSAFGVEYARYAAAGFTTLLGGFGATTPSEVTAQAAACVAAGLACIPASCETETSYDVPGSCVGAPAAPVMGYQLKDEPQAPEFPALAAWSASVAARAPGALRFINLLPNYGFTAPSSPVYEEYVADFVRIVRPDLLSFDHYPQWGAADDADVSPAGFIRNLRVVRAAAQGAGIAFWLFFNSMPYGGRSDVSEAQLRWQVYTALAHGAKGVMYFCYWSPAAAAGSTFEWGGAIMTPRSLPNSTNVTYVEGPKYAQAARLNARLSGYGAFLLRATSALVVGLNGTGSNVVPVTGGPAGTITAVGGSGAGPTWSVLLGAFTAPLPQGRASAWVVHNSDTLAPAIITLEFSPGVAPDELDGATGAVAPAYDDAPALPGFQLTLDAGDARVLVF